MKYLLIALSLLVVGCNVDNPDCWEYESHMPATSKPEDLLAVQSMLYSNGYERVRIKHSNFSLCYVILATRKESEVTK